MRDLGTLPGDSTSQALGINDRRQIVGTSCDADFNCRAVIWRKGVIADLNALVASGYEDTVTTANDINESGRITGQALEKATGTLVAFTARP
jgi:probable HAF family extracellular repeat protein